MFKKLKNQLLFGLLASFTTPKDFSVVDPGVLVQKDEEGKRSYNPHAEDSSNYQILQFPPDLKPEERVFSDVYQRDIPKSLVDAGIEKVDVQTGEAILGISRVMGSARALKESAKGYCGLDLQDRVGEIYQRLGKFVEGVDVDALAGKLGEENPLVKMVQEANERYDFWKGRKSHIVSLTERYPDPEDDMLVWGRYLG